MATQVQWRGGSTSEHSTFTGAAREVTVDTQKKTLVVHDGSTAGGEPLLREDGSNSALDLGSAATPALKFTGDTNTGIYSPGADQFAISTGGAGRLFVNASGRLGIGTISPTGGADNLIDVYGAASSAINFHNAGTGTGATDGGVVGQYGNDLTLYNYETGDIQFGTNNQLRVTIDNSGRLLVGTSTARTNYLNSSAYGPLLNLEGTSNSNRVLSFIHNDSSGGPYLVLGSTGGSTAGSNDLVAAQSTLGFLSWQGADGSELVEAASIKVQVDGTPDANIMPGRLVFSTTADQASSPTPRMTIKSDGKVGLGTTDPAGGASNFIDVYGSASSAINFHNAGTGTGATDGGVVGQYSDDLVLYNYENGTIQFGTNNQLRTTIDSFGRLLVGASSWANTSRAVFSGNSSDNLETYVDFNRGTAATGADAYIALLNFRNGGSDTCASIHCQTDGTCTAGDSPGRLVFSVTADELSSPTEALRITNDRSFRITQAPGKYSVSTSDGATSIANNGTVSFSNFSGLIMVNDHSGGSAQVWLVGGGNVSSLGTVTGTAGSLAYDSGVDGYTWTNNTGTTRTFGFFCIRTRAGA